jgi:DNA-binding CsgD family transcriptional regulator
MENQLKDVGGLISESATSAENLMGKSAFQKHMRQRHLDHFIEKFPDAQHEDIEIAFRNALKKVLKKKPETKRHAEKIFKKAMEEGLSDLHKNKKQIKKNLSCVKLMKSASDDSIPSIIKRAEKILTGKERRVLGMCSQGKSVRSMAKDMNMSHPTVWRTLNSAIDKIRMSHGIRPRYKDIRKNRS